MSWRWNRNSQTRESVVISDPVYSSMYLNLLVVRIKFLMLRIRVDSVH
jgi:hypothetical protein